MKCGTVGSVGDIIVMVMMMIIRFDLWDNFNLLEINISINILSFRQFIGFIGKIMDGFTIICIVEAEITNFIDNIDAYNWWASRWLVVFCLHLHFFSPPPLSISQLFTIGQYFYLICHYQVSDRQTGYLYRVSKHFQLYLTPIHTYTIKKPLNSNKFTGFSTKITLFGLCNC